MSKVFISYSHDSEEHANRVLSFSNQLVKNGINCILDQYVETPSEGWPRWMDQNIKNSDFVLMICTENYCNRVMGKEEIGKGLGVKWEGKLIYNQIYFSDTKNTKFIPVLFNSQDTTYIPDPLKDTTYYTVNLKEGYENLYRRITGQSRISKPKVGTIKKLSKHKVSDFFDSEDLKEQPEKIEISTLPNTSPDVFGRETELDILDKAWEDPKTKILSFIAWGGVGKSALINAWLNKMDEQNYKGADLVYGWSFYSQGTKEKGQASTDGFFYDAFKWFGYNGEIPKTQHEKGRKLSEIISEQKTLLILDGLEPLQYPPGEMYGFLKDQTMTGLLKNLVRNLNGLCIITSRCNVKDLQATEGRASLTHELENLSEQAGMAVLKSYNLKGTDKEFIETSNEFNGHALALHLVGSYLKTVFNGDIRQRELIPKLTEEETQGGHVRRVMESYEIWFAENNKPELDILSILGLFDRPASKESIDVLTAKPAIKNLTESLQSLSFAQWQTALQHLRELHLIATMDEHNPDTLDCHPLIREHFGEKLEQQNPEAWKEAHARLYEYYKKLPEKLYGKELPDTLEEMEPLFAAVMHGCLAGKYQEAMDDVYYSRIHRGSNTNYCCSQLGAFGADLSCLSSFFESLWNKPASGLKESDKAVTLSYAGFRLRAVGRISEAAQPMNAALEMRMEQKKDEEVARIAINLSELYLTLGEVVLAQKYGKQSMTFADRIENSPWKEASRSTQAVAFFQVGKNKVAEKLFIEAENMQKKRESEFPYLYSFWGFLFCDLLLSMGKYQEVLKRAQTTIKYENKEWYSLLCIADDKLTIGKAYMLLGDFAESEKYLIQAVDGLREAGTQHNLPWGLFARATLFRHQNDFLKSWVDLNEAREIAEYGQMRLYLTDYHLEACRNIKAQFAISKTKKEFTIIEEGIEKNVSKEKMKKLFNEHIAKAGKLIEKTGYHRRDKELTELREFGI